MSDEATKIPEEAIVLTLAEHESHGGPVPLPEDSLKKFGGVYPLYLSLRQAFGDRLLPAVLDGGVIRMGVQPSRQNGICYDLDTFMDDMEATTGELRRNADLAKPLPFAAAVRRPALVAILQAVSRIHRCNGLEVTVKGAGEPRSLPVPPPTTFVQVDTDSELRRSGSFPVKGLVRDDQRGHQLLVTNNELRVLLPVDDKRWAWHAVRHVLDDKALLVGVLIRESRAHPWVVDSSARLQVQPDLVMTD
ncbi:MAG: hypothetical protein WBA33_07135 [Rhodanobacter lindaniclasticus]